MFRKILMSWQYDLVGLILNAFLLGTSVALGAYIASAFFILGLFCFTVCIIADIQGWNDNAES